MEEWQGSRGAYKQSPLPRPSVGGWGAGLGRNDTPPGSGQRAVGSLGAGGALAPRPQKANPDPGDE